MKHKRIPVLRAASWRDADVLWSKLMAVSAILILIAACGSSTKESLLKDGVDALNKGDTQGAVVFLKNALNRDQNFFEARFHLARAYVQRADYSAAEKELQKILMQHPNYEGASLLLARVFIHTARPDDALDLLRGPAARGNREAMEQEAMALAVKGDYPSAIRILEGAVSAEPHSPGADISLARLYLEAGDSAKAVSSISRAIEAAPGNVDALLLRSDIEEAGGDLKSALATLDGILKEENNFRALVRKGSFLNKAGRYEESLAVSDLIIKDFPDSHEGYKLKGVAHFHQKRFDDATIYLQKAVSLKPDAAVHYLLGICHYQKKEYEQAASSLYRALDLDPSFTQARTLAALVLLTQRRYEDAITEGERAVASPGDNAIAHMVLGNAHLGLGQFDKGMQEFEKALELDPASVSARMQVGLANLSRGRDEQAESEMLAALDIDPSALNTRAILASLYSRREEYAKAMDILEAGTTGRKTDAVIYSLMAGIMKRQDRIGDAIQFTLRAQTADPTIARIRADLASLYFINGEFDNSLRVLEPLGDRCDNITACLTMAAIYELRGEGDKAGSRYLKASETGKTVGHVSLANYYLGRGEPARAVDVLKGALREERDNIDLHETLGRTLISLHRYEEALSTFNVVERRVPGRGVPDIVNIYILMKKPEFALDAVGEALKKDPGKIELRIELSRIYLAMGRKGEAIANTESVIRDNPRAANGYAMLGTLYKHGDIDKAIEAMERGIRSNGTDASLYIALGNYYAFKKDYGPALKTYREAEKLRAGYVPAVFNQGAVLHSMGKEKEAIAEYLRVLRSSQNHELALNNLSCLYACDTRDRLKSLHYASRAFLLNPASPSILDTFGVALLKNGKAKEAANVLKKAANIMPRASINYHLSLAYNALGYKTKAIEQLNSALESEDFEEREEARQLMAKLSGGQAQ